MFFRRLIRDEILNIWEVDKFFLFFIFVIPGFVAIKAYGLFNPVSSMDSSKKIIESIIYSSINYAIIGYPFLFIISYTNNIVLIFITSIFSLFIFPIIIAFLFTKVRKLDFFLNNAPHPTPKAWDFIFKKRQTFWVIVELNDGSKIGGLYGSNSFTSNYPESEQIYLEEKWVLDGNDGFDRIREGSSGVLIVTSQIKTIEFFKC